MVVGVGMHSKYQVVLRVMMGGGRFSGVDGLRGTSATFERYGICSNRTLRAIDLQTSTSQDTVLTTLC
jgi:hypothetical protein